MQMGQHDSFKFIAPTEAIDLKPEIQRIVASKYQRGLAFNRQHPFVDVLLSDRKRRSAHNLHRVREDAGRVEIFLRHRVRLGFLCRHCSRSYCGILLSEGPLHLRSREPLPAEKEIAALSMHEHPHALARIMEHAGNASRAQWREKFDLRL